jgi:uncharacterized protein (DUF1800 family)
MRRKAYWGLGMVLILAAYAETASFSKQISGDDRIQQALNRLTFGARPGDVKQVKTMGLKKWIDLQLHPDRIPENPVLLEKLKTFDTLNMSSKELVRNYPAPQIVKQMVAGQIPFPSDPDRRMLIQKLVKRNEAKQGDATPPPDAPNQQKLAALLSRDEIRSLRTGTPQERLAALEALPHDKQDEVISALPQGMRQGIFAVAPPDLRRRIEFTGGPAQVVARDLQEGKILRAVYSNRQLDEVLTDFWFNHFNVFLDKGADHYLTTEYEREAIRPHVLGKFRDLLEATAKSPAMLFYLDNWESVGAATPAAFVGRGPNAQRRGLNENYGRELLELHTLGVDGGYTQKDVTEVARCFTGWSIDRPQQGGSFRFADRQHDLGEKMVLGVRIPEGGGEKDGEKVLDIVARHPSTAHFISKKLAQRFVADDPPAALVERMAQTFLKTDGDIRAVMQTMLESKEFWSEGAYRSKMKSPLEVVVSAVRASNGNVDFANALVNQVAQLGEPLYRKIEPTGYSNSSREWMNTAGLMARMNFAVQLSGNKVPGVTVEQTAASTDTALGSPEFQKR